MFVNITKKTQQILCTSWWKKGIPSMTKQKNPKQIKPLDPTTN